MSQQIETWRVDAFKTGVYHLAQQKGSRLAMCVRNESQSSKTDFYDQLGATEVSEAGGRHSDTVYTDSVHARRAVTMRDYDWADLVDKEDKLRIINDPTSSYQIAASYAFGRKKDDIIISALGGTSYTGEEGTTPIVLPTTQKIASVASNALVNLNVDALRHAKELFDAADFDPDLIRYFGITSSQLRALLSQTEITSADYANVKALVEGKVDQFMGFTFKRLERFQVNADSSVKFDLATGEYSGSGTASTGRKCYAWIGDGLLLSTGTDVTASVDKIPTKRNSTQIYMNMSLGATRMEEKKVIEIHCKE